MLGAVAAAQSGHAQAPSLDDLFPRDRVIEVQITLDPSDWDKIRHQVRGLADALHPGRRLDPDRSPYTYVEASVTIDGATYPKVGLRKKGFVGSQDNERPSLKIKLSRFDDTQSIGGLDNLTLNNNKQDKSLMSQFMGYHLFSAAGAPAPRCAFARVTVNGMNLGVYSHVETIRRPLLEREFDRSDGTLLEATVTDFYPGWEQSFERKFGDDRAARDRIRALSSALDVDRAEDLDQRAIWDIVDERAFYTFWAMEGLLSFWDGYSGNRNNYFIYLEPKTRKFHFLPWGADCMFEKYSQLGEDPRSPRSVRMLGLLTNRLYQHREVRARYARTMRGLLASLWNERALLAEADRIADMLDPYLRGQQQRDFDVAFDKVYGFIRERRGDVEAEVRRGDMPEWRHDPEPPPVIGQIKYDGLHAAAKDGDLGRLRGHLRRGADVNEIDREQGSALGLAAVTGQLEAVELLLQRGADPDAQDKDGNVPLHGAALMGERSAAALLLKAGADPNIRDDEGHTPLDVASAPWNDEFAELVDIIATVVGIEVDTETIKADRQATASLLRQRGGKYGGELPEPVGGELWQAAKRGDVDALEELLRSGADPNKLDRKGITPLCWAAMAGHEQAARVLLEQGADINGRNQDGATPLHGAVFFAAQPVVDLLLEQGADVGARNKDGRTPLDTIAGGWSPEMQGVVTWIAGSLQLKVDPQQIRSAWPGIAAKLRARRR